MGKKNYMSGSELRQYLHISTRKMKYLMNHEYIPHKNTGQATHKYQVLGEDAIAFKYRMENEPGFLAELTGKFSSKKEYRPRATLLQPTPENCAAFRGISHAVVERPARCPADQTDGRIGRSLPAATV